MIKRRVRAHTSERIGHVDTEKADMQHLRGRHPMCRSQPEGCMCGLAVQRCHARADSTYVWILRLSNMHVTNQPMLLSASPSQISCCFLHCSCTAPATPPRQYSFVNEQSPCTKWWQARCIISPSHSPTPGNALSCMTQFQTSHASL